MTYATVSLRIDPDMLSEIDNLARDENVDRSRFLRTVLQTGLKDLKIEHAIKQYDRGRISMGRMVEITGLSRHDLFRELKEHGVSVHYSRTRLLDECNDL